MYFLIRVHKILNCTCSISVTILKNHPNIKVSTATVINAINSDMSSDVIVKILFPTLLYSTTTFSVLNNDKY